MLCSNLRFDQLLHFHSHTSVQFDAARLRPKLARDFGRVDAGCVEPGLLVAGAMDGAVVDAAKRYRELVADLAAERTWLRKPEVVGITGFSRTNQASLLGDKPQVLLVATAARCVRHEATRTCSSTGSTPRRLRNKPNLCPLQPYRILTPGC